MIALDTHFWIWFHLGDPRLTDNVTSRIGRDTVVSTATIWEATLLLEKGRIVSEYSPQTTVQRWLDAAPMRIVPIDREIVFLSRSLSFLHEDPADRFIAATAFSCNLPLATLDGRLRSLTWLKTIC